MLQIFFQKRPKNALAIKGFGAQNAKLRTVETQARLPGSYKKKYIIYHINS